MILVALGMVALVAAVAAGVIGLCLLQPSWTPYAIVLTAVILFTTAGKYGTATGLMLGAVGAERSRSEDDPELHTMLERLSTLADLPVANAFTSGVRRRNATVVMTTSLPSELEPHELEAVLAHELAHVANRDAGVMTLASVPRTLGETIMANRDSRGRKSASRTPTCVGSHESRPCGSSQREGTVRELLRPPAARAPAR